MRIRVLFIIVLALLGLVSCRTTRLAKAPILSLDNGQFTVIGTMHSRDKVVTVKTGAAGIVYSIATKDGQMLHENISAEKLKAEVPALHELIDAGYAALYRGSAGPSGIFRDNAGYAGIYAGR